MLRKREVTLRARETRVDRTLRSTQTDAMSAELELFAHRDRLAAEHEAEERRLRALGLSGTLPLARKKAAARDVDLEAFGLISVSTIFDDVERARCAPGSIASPSISAFTESTSGELPRLAAPPPSSAASLRSPPPPSRAARAGATSRPPRPRQSARRRTSPGARRGRRGARTHRRPASGTAACPWDLHRRS